MQLSKSQGITYALFAQMVLLLLLWAGAALLTAIKFLPEDPLAQSLPYSQSSALAHVLLMLAVQTGLLAGGVHMAISRHTGAEIIEYRLLRWGQMGWALLAILAVTAGVLGILEGRLYLELPPVLDGLAIVSVGLILAAVWNNRGDSASLFVWCMGAFLLFISGVAGLLPVVDYGQDVMLGHLVVSVRLYIAEGLMALALTWWVLKRISTVPQEWANSALYTTAGLLSIAGMLLTVAALVDDGVTQFVGPITFVSVPILCWMIAAHSYRPLSQRGPAQTLAGHWIALGVILLLAGPGFVGSISALPGVQAVIPGTRLDDLLYTLSNFAWLAICMGMLNQAVAELRGHNRRITGLLPFWLVSFGVIISSAGLAAAGIIQIYMERLIGIGYLDAQRLMVPLYLIWIGGLLLVAMGIGVYALGFRARRLVAG